MSRFKNAQFRLHDHQKVEAASRGVLRKTCAENMQQICMRTPIPKCEGYSFFSAQLRVENFCIQREFSEAYLRPSQSSLMEHFYKAPSGFGLITNQSTSYIFKTPEFYVSLTFEIIYYLLNGSINSCI